MQRSPLKTRPDGRVARADAEQTDARVIPVYVWELPVRLVHWTIFFSIVILSVTGYYLHNPFIVVGSHGGRLLLVMRFIHEVTAFVFTMAFLVRVYWFFMGNRYAHWRAFVPLTRAQWVNGLQMLKYYLFLRWRAPSRVGHNSLAALAYLGIYLLMLVQILTGLGLYSRVVGTGIWHALFSWIPNWINVQYLRETHYLIMFMFFGFTIHHVYSALLVSAEEKNGLMGSIFNGYKFVSVRLLRQEELIQENVVTEAPPVTVAPESTAATATED